MQSVRKIAGGKKTGGDGNQRARTSSSPSAPKSIISDAVMTADGKPHGRPLPLAASSTRKMSTADGSPSVHESDVGGFVERYLRVYPDRETTFTDKDRAAAVAMGTKDIKVSLQVKKKRERRRDEPGEREFRIRFALADRELRSANPARALHFIAKALELRPKSRECFVVRSKCHLMLGQSSVALDDAETALAIDAEFVKGVCAKGDALYAIGDFEHALVCYHRGRHLRPDSDEFRLGIQKSEEAIQNVIDYNYKVNCKHSPLSSSGGHLSHQDKIQPASDLQTDIEFLTKLLKNSEIRSLRQPESRIIKKHVNEVLDFLNSREEFWSQQKPRKKAA